MRAAEYTMSFYSENRNQVWSAIDVLHGLIKLGLEEAANIWPTKRLDILVELGSGLPHLDHELMLALDVESPGQWSPSMSKWVGGLLNGQLAKASPVIFQLNLILSRHFGLNGVDSIAEISHDTDRWLGERNDTIVEVANHLVAGLFFFTPAQDPALHLGTISCRLPWDLEARMKLVAHLITVARRCKLFTTIGSWILIDTLPALEGLRHGQDLVIKVTNAYFDGKLDISMADIFRESDKRYPISGCS
jgi:hypothetical protein